MNRSKRVNWSWELASQGGIPSSFLHTSCSSESNKAKTSLWVMQIRTRSGIDIAIAFERHS